MATPEFQPQPTAAPSLEREEPVAMDVGQQAQDEIAEDDVVSVDVGNLAEDPNFRAYQSAMDRKMAQLQKQLESIKNLPDIPGPTAEEEALRETLTLEYERLEEDFQRADEDGDERRAERAGRQMQMVSNRLYKADLTVFAKKAGVDPGDKGLTEYLQQQSIGNTYQLEAAINRYALQGARQAKTLYEKEMERQRKAMAQEQRQQEAVTYHESGGTAVPATAPRSSASNVESARREYQQLGGQVGAFAAIRRLQLQREYPELLNNR